MFRPRAFAGGMLATLAFFSGPPALFFAITIALHGLGFSPLHTALAHRLGRRLMLIGALVVALGIAGLLVAVDLARHGLTARALLPGLVVTGSPASRVRAARERPPSFDVLLHDGIPVIGRNDALGVRDLVPARDDVAMRVFVHLAPFLVADVQTVMAVKTAALANDLHLGRGARTGGAEALVEGFELLLVVEDPLLAIAIDHGGSR